MIGLRIAVLSAVTALAALAAMVAVPTPWSELGLEVATVWTAALSIAAALVVRAVEPPREVRMGPLSPLLGGVLAAGLVIWHPTVVGASLAAIPFALTAHLRWTHALRTSLADVPFEQWEAAWLLGATHTQAVRHAVLPAATELRPRMIRATGDVLMGLALPLAALVMTA